MKLDDEIQKNINEYIDRYCKKHEVDRETAKTHLMVKLVSEYFKDRDKDKVVETAVVDPADCGCVEDRSC